MAVLLGLTALIVLLVVGLAQVPRDSAIRHWLLLLAIVVLPGLALVMGADQAMEAAKSPEFCGSCHVMGPWISDLKDPNSKNLAALHYQNRYILENQCFTCHSDYGFTGPLRAKLTGMLHLLRYETGTYTLPIELYEPYHFDNCLHCHSESKKYIEAHTDVAESIQDGSMTCIDCHQPVHPEQEKKK